MGGGGAPLCNGDGRERLCLQTRGVCGGETLGSADEVEVFSWRERGGRFAILDVTYLRHDRDSLHAHVMLVETLTDPPLSPSVPPAHTSIGILAALIVHLEAHAPVLTLELDTPVFDMASCLAAHAPDIPPKLKRAGEMLVEDPMTPALLGTTQAVDLISGGVKSNALPEQAVALVNHRIATQSSVKATITRDADLVLDLAARFNLAVTAYGERLIPESVPAYGTLELSAPQTLEPAPITPSGSGARPYALLAGTIRSVFRAARTGGAGVEGIVVALGIMTGNTGASIRSSLSLLETGG
ncbi:hypothetical protein B0H12DRAFT_342835 [Mycena haematopus]|nr:hypothetical protein B0H12DRAFT_342835 [Mycena haematopus]